MSNRVLEDLKKLKDIYSETADFEIGKNLSVKLKILSSTDETEVHTYAMQFEKGISYLFAIKKETVTRAIIGLNGKEIPEFVEELNENGIVEKIQRHSWLRKNVIHGWSQLLVDAVWNKYAILMAKVEDNISDNIETEDTPKA